MLISIHKTIKKLVTMQNEYILYNF